MLQCINFDILENQNVNLKHAKTHGESWLTGLFKDNKNCRKRCEICSKLTIKITESGVFIVHSEHISHIF